jgi:hypothetical protein
MPALTGSSATPNTIGMVEVAALGGSLEAITKSIHRSFAVLAACPIVLFKRF